MGRFALPPPGNGTVAAVCFSTTREISDTVSVLLTMTRVYSIFAHLPITRNRPTKIRKPQIPAFLPVNPGHIPPDRGKTGTTERKRCSPRKAPCFPNCKGVQRNE